MNDEIKSKMREEHFPYDPGQWQLMAGRLRPFNRRAKLRRILLLLIPVLLLSSAIGYYLTSGMFGKTHTVTATEKDTSTHTGETAAVHQHTDSHSGKALKLKETAPANSLPFVSSAQSDVARTKPSEGTKAPESQKIQTISKSKGMSENRLPGLKELNVYDANTSVKSEKRETDYSTPQNREPKDTSHKQEFPPSPGTGKQKEKTSQSRDTGYVSDENANRDSLPEIVGSRDSSMSVPADSSVSHPTNSKQELAGRQLKSAILLGSGLSTGQSNLITAPGFRIGGSLSWTMKGKHEIGFGIAYNRMNFILRSGEFGTHIGITRQPPSQLSANLDLIELPLFYSRYFRRRTSSAWFVRGGLHSYLYLREQYRFTYNSVIGLPGSPENWTVKSLRSQWISNIELSLGYQHKIKDKGYLEISPYINSRVLEFMGAVRGNVKSLGIQLKYSLSE